MGGATTRQLKRIVIGLLCAAGGYIVAAIAGYFLVLQFSGNAHDREVEAAMTAAFVFGPAAALVAFIVGVAKAGRLSARLHAEE